MKVGFLSLPLIGHLLTSADSMAWSLHARLNHVRLPGADNLVCLRGIGNHAYGAG